MLRQIWSTYGANVTSGKGSFCALHGADHGRKRQQQQKRQEAENKADQDGKCRTGSRNQRRSGREHRIGNIRQGRRLGRERGPEWHWGRVQSQFVACLPGNPTCITAMLLAGHPGRG